MLDQLSPLTMIQVDFIQMNDYPADSCAISPAAFLLFLKPKLKKIFIHQNETAHKSCLYFQ